MKTPSTRSNPAIAFGEFSLVPIEERNPYFYGFVRRRDKKWQFFEKVRIEDHQWSAAFLAVLCHPDCPRHLALDPVEDVEWTDVVALNQLRRELSKRFGPFPENAVQSLFDRGQTLSLGDYVFHQSHDQMDRNIVNGYRLRHKSEGQIIQVTIPFLAELAAHWLRDRKQQKFACYRPWLVTRPGDDFAEGDLRKGLSLSAEEFAPKRFAEPVIPATPTGLTPTLAVGPGELIGATVAVAAPAVNPLEDFLSQIGEAAGALLKLSGQTPAGLDPLVGVSLLHLSGPLGTIAKYCGDKGIVSGTVLFAEVRRELEGRRRGLTEREAKLEADTAALRDKELTLRLSIAEFERRVGEVVAAEETRLLALRAATTAEAGKLDEERAALQPALDDLAQQRRELEALREELNGERELLQADTVAADTRQRDLEQRERTLAVAETELRAREAKVAAVQQQLERGLFDKFAEVALKIKK